MRRSAGSTRPRVAASRARSQEAVPQGMKLAAAVLLLLAQGRGTGTDSLAGRARRLVDSYVAAYFERHPDEATLAGVAGVRHDRWPANSPHGIAHWWLPQNAWLAEPHVPPGASLAGR